MNVCIHLGHQKFSLVRWDLGLPSELRSHLNVEETQGSSPVDTAILGFLSVSSGSQYRASLETVEICSRVVRWEARATVMRYGNPTFLEVQQGS